ncbi:MAG: response regulator transcription factor [Fulvivirga sp.]
MKKLLIVEDDNNLGQLLAEYLELKSFEVELCRDGAAGLQAFKTRDFDLCILDVMMPKKDGFELANEIKQIKPQIPFIFLTAKSMRDDAINGLKIGADDYITKPFSMEELLLRLDVIFRRKPQNKVADQEIFTHKNLTFDTQKRLLCIDSKVQKLTHKESELLRLLFMHKNEMLPRKKALYSIWQDDNYFNSRSMDVYITKLRKYLKAHPDLEIMTIHGEGFKLVNLT